MSDSDWNQGPESDDSTLSDHESKDGHDMKLAALRAALIEGEESGRADTFLLDTFLREKRANYQPRPKR